MWKSCLIVFLIAPRAFAVGTADWMQEMYSAKAETRLIDIVIPGTHNSGTYKINYMSQVEPGETFLYNFIKPIVAGWSKTQFKTIYEQLLLGIRFLDLRIAFNRKGQAYVVHGLVSLPLKQVLNQISRFTDQHPKEIVLLAYELEFAYLNRGIPVGKGDAILQRVDEIVADHFRDRMISFSSGRTFLDFWDGNYSVMVLKDYQNFWPNKHDLKSVKSYLDYAIANKDPNRFSNLQLIFTEPSDLSVFLNLYYAVPLFSDQNSLSIFSAPLRAHGLPWVKDWQNAGYRANIITTDFFDQFAFVQTILDINLH